MAARHIKFTQHLNGVQRSVRFKIMELKGYVEKGFLQRKPHKKEFYIDVPYDALPHDTPIETAKQQLGELPEGWRVKGMFTDNTFKKTSILFRHASYLPSFYQIDDKVNLKIKASTQTHLIEGCEVDAVLFYEKAFIAAEEPKETPKREFVVKYDLTMPSCDATGIPFQQVDGDMISAVENSSIEKNWPEGVLKPGDACEINVFSDFTTAPIKGCKVACTIFHGGTVSYDVAPPEKARIIERVHSSMVGSVGHFTGTNPLPDADSNNP